MKYRLAVPVMVEVYIDIEAEDEFEAMEKYQEQDLDFSLVESYGQGVALQPLNDELNAVASDPDYNNLRINAVKEDW
jgi:cell division protein FtsI/penicillin-binding protein 2